MAKYGVYKCKDCKHVFTLKMTEGRIIRCPGHTFGGGYDVEFLGGNK
jgi:hypothetical protein